MRYVQQLDEADCGAACIAMVISHYNVNRSVTYIRELACTDTRGTNLQGMINACKYLGFKAKALKGNEKSISAELPVPFIAHINKEINGILFQHFVVVKKITGKYVYIWDPDSNEKKYKLTLQNFYKIWTGYVLFISPENNISEIKNSNSKLLYKFLPLLKAYKKLLILACLASVLIVVFGIVSTFYTRYVIDEVLFSHAKVTLFSLSIAMLLVVSFKAIIEAIRKITLTHFAYKINLKLVFTYFTHVFKLPLKFFDSRKTGEIISRMQDISKIQQVLSQALISIVMDVALVIFVIPILFMTNSYLFFIILLTVPLSTACLYFYSKIYKKQYKKMMSSASDLQSYLVESINGAYTVKAMACENFILKGYENYQMAMTNSAWKTAHYSVYQELFSELIKQLSSIVVFWVGSYLIIEGKLSVGTLISFTSLSAYFSNPIERLVNTQSTLQEAFVAADRLGEILELEIEQKNQQGLRKITEIKENIVFDNVAFRYGTRNLVLNDLTFSINKGEKIAFVGPSGCGKTTLSKLILKFYSPEKGKITSDGINIEEIDAESLRSNIGYVPQEISLFSGTVAQNISVHFPKASMDEIKEAAELAGAAKFISKLEGGYNALLGEHGFTLSGGERQRLALARALLGNPKLIIMDEATSNLDSVSEFFIKQTIDRLKSQNITIIIIAHRLSTVIDCDKIFVMKDGHIVQSGKHKQLLLIDGQYKNMWEGMLG